MNGDTTKKSTPYTVPIGPVHPALKEPVMFTFQMEGEVVKSVDFAPGNTHRGIEWMGMRRNPVQIVHLYRPDMRHLRDCALALVCTGRGADCRN